ncbi:triphosphoribosyl-dephospho-CoA synthase [Haladaptatus pallidirubidus]|uniref:Triphosphoribosyl-dephospho-CoA synthase n=1 Tax=Haladaptatus pallidirubidus TaxID=1008152 RepID=A0AAV3UCS8_9EURY|nr:triphosphoribosyl-dephospho-CoA synthase [Haladaptatus pallidirubidus]
MTPAEHAQLALLLEVAGTPKPGNVDRDRDFPDLRFEHFLAGAVGSGSGMRSAEAGIPVGEAFEEAIAGMSQQSGGNTQFGALCLLVPLVKASATDACSPDGVTAVVENTTVEDATGFYRAFDHVNVFVDDPPEGADEFDARRGSDAIPAIRDAGITLYDVMELGADEDDIAREWTSGFERTFEAGERIVELDGSLSGRGARVYLELLSREPDTFVAKQHGKKTAESVRVRAQEALQEVRQGNSELVHAFSDSLVEDGINPGTTADIVAGGLFVALERGVRP